MRFSIKEIHSATDVIVKAPYACVIVKSQERISISVDEIGFLEGKRTHHHSGIFMQGGILNPGWEGYLSIELLVFGECHIRVGDEIAHAIILEGENTEGYTFKD